MRKEIVYSLAAVAAFPVVASAAESGVDCQNLIAGSGTSVWLTDEAGVQIEAGKYQLRFSAISGGTQVGFRFYKKNTNGGFDAVTLKDGETTIINRVSMANKNTPAFDLEGGVYKIELYKLTDGDETITAGDPTLQLVFDFQAACTTLKTKLVDETNIAGEYRDPRCEGDITKFNDVLGIIDSIGMVNYDTELAKLSTETTPTAAQFAAAYGKEWSPVQKANVNAKGYELYQKYELYNIEDEEATDSLTRAINKIADEARAHEADYMGDAVAALREQVNDLEDGTLKQGLLTDLAAIDGDNGLIDKFEGKTKTSAAVWSEIDAASQDVQNALAMDAFYKETAKPRYEEVQAALTAARDSVDLLLVNDTAGVRTLADAAFGAIQTELTKIIGSVDAAYQAGTLGNAENKLWAFKADSEDGKGLKDSLDHIWIAGTEAQDAVLYADVNEYNAAKGTSLTAQEFEALENKIKTPAVAAAPATGSVADTLAYYSQLAFYLQYADSVMNNDTLFVGNGDYIPEKANAGDDDDMFESLPYVLEKYQDVFEATKADGTPLNLVSEEDTATYKAGVKEAVEALIVEVKAKAKVATKPAIAALNEALGAKVDDVIEALEVDEKWDTYLAQLNAIARLKATLKKDSTERDTTYNLKRINDAEYLTENNLELEYAFNPKFNLSNDDADAYRQAIREELYVLFHDSINAKIDTLKDNMKTVAGFNDKVAAIGDEITEMYTKMDAAAKKFVETQIMIDSLYDELKALEARAAEAGLLDKKYPMTVGESTVYIGGYQEKIDSIMGNVRKEQLDKIGAYQWPDATANPAVEGGWKEEYLGNGIATIQALLDSALVTTGIKKGDGEYTAKNDSTFDYWMNKIYAVADPVVVDPVDPVVVDPVDPVGPDNPGTNVPSPSRRFGPAKQPQVSATANLSDTTLIRKCIDLLKANFEQDSANVAALAEAAAFDLLKEKVRNLCDSLDNMITRIEEGIPAQDAQEATYYANVDEYNQAKGTTLTEEEFNALTQEQRIKTPAQDAQAAVPGLIEGLLEFDQNEVRTMLKTVKDSLAKNEQSGVIGDDYEAAGTFFSNVRRGDDARASVAQPYSETLYNQLGKDSEKLRDLIDIMSQIKDYIANAMEAKEKNDQARDRMLAIAQDFLEKVEAAKALVAEQTQGEDGPVGGQYREVYTLVGDENGTLSQNANLISAKPWYNAKLGAIPEGENADVVNIPTEDLVTAIAESYPEGSIMDSFKKIVNDATESYNNGELVGDTIELKERLAALTTDLTKATDTLKYKQQSLNALRTIEAFDGLIQEAEDLADENLDKEEPGKTTPNAREHYDKEIDKIMLAYEGHTPLRDEEKYFRGENSEEADSIGALDNAYYDYKGDTLQKTQDVYTAQVVGTIVALSKVADRAHQNKTNWPTIKNDSTKLLGLINAEAAKITAPNYELGDSAEVKAAILALIPEVQAIDVEELYVNGGLEDDSLQSTEFRLKKHQDIKDKLDNILIQAKLDYAQRLAAQQVKNELEAKAKQARETYKEAVELDDAYKMLQSSTLRDAVDVANEQSVTYNNALKEYPNEINAISDTAYAHINKYFEENTEGKYDITPDTNELNRIIAEIEALRDGYKTVADNAIETAASEFLDSVNRALNDSSFLVEFAPKFAKYMQYDTATVVSANNPAYGAAEAFFAALVDKRNSLKNALDTLNANKNTGIQNLDQALCALENWKEDEENATGKTFGQVKEEKLAARAKEDLLAGLAKAEATITNGNRFFYGVADMTEVPESDLNEAWEALKETITGNTQLVQVAGARMTKVAAQEVVLNYGLDWIIRNKINAQNHEAKYDSISAVINDFLAVTTEIINSQEAKDRWDAALNANPNKPNGDAKGSLQDQLNAAEKAAEDFAVIDKMKNTEGYKLLQDWIDEKKSAAAAAAELGICSFTAQDSIDSVKISRSIDIYSKLISDTIKTDSSDYIADITASKTLFRQEQAFLAGKENQLWTLFNAAAANKWADAPANRIEPGKAHEAEITAIFDKLTKFVAKVDADPKKASVDSLLEIQGRIAAEFELLVTDAGAAEGKLGGNAVKAVKDELDVALQAAKDSIDALQARIAAGAYEGMTADQTAAISTALTAIETEANGISIPNNHRVLTFKEQYEEKIANVNRELAALKAKVDEQNAENKVLADNLIAAAALLEPVLEAQEDMDEAFGKFNNLTNDYTNRRQLLDQRVAALVQAVENATKPIDLTEFQSSCNNVISDIRSLVNAASKDDITNIAQQLENRADAIELDQNDFLASDYATLSQRLTNIKNGIAQYQQGWFGQRGQLIGGLKADAQSTQEHYFGADNKYQYDNLKDSAAVLTARLDSLEQAIVTLIGGGDLPPVVLLPGDIDGDGFVTSDDVEEFLDDLLEGDLPERNTAMFIIYDVNEDGLINIADAQGIQNLSLGLNVDGSVPDVLAARSTEALSGSVTAESTQLQNGAQRIVLTLNGNFDWTGFQLDVKGAEVLSESAAITLKSAEKNGTHRIVAFGSKQGNGQVITLDVQGNAKLGTITFTTPDAQAVSFKLSGTTGIYGISTESNNIFYDLSGKLVKGMKKGVNIIRDAAGKAKKAIMK